MSSLVAFTTIELVVLSTTSVTFFSTSSKLSSSTALYNESTKVHKPRCRNSVDSKFIGWVWSRRVQGELTDIKSRSGQLSSRGRRTERSIYTFFVHRTLTISNASEAIPSSKSDWTLSRRKADSASTAKK